jgi:pyridoxine 5'-phosphate synthase PdxJ
MFARTRKGSVPTWNLEKSRETDQEFCFLAILLHPPMDATITKPSSWTLLWERRFTTTVLSGLGKDQQLLIFDDFAKEVEADLIMLCIFVENIERINAARAIGAASVEFTL